MGAPLGPSPSLIWRSILWGRENAKVADLITDSRVGDLALLTNHFCGEDKEAITSIALGKYLVKTGYRVALSQCDENSDIGGSDSSTRQSFRKQLWKLEVPSKIKNLVWRACLDIFPSAVNLYKRKVIQSQVCFRCGKYYEDACHALWSCKVSKQFWRCTGFAGRFKISGGSFADLFDPVIRACSQVDVERFVCSVWKLWQTRNDMLHGKSIPRVQDLVERTMELYGGYKSCLVRPQLFGVSRQIKWVRSPLHTFMLNCDGALDREGERRGGGGVGCCRDNAGRFICGFATFSPLGMNVLCTELVALREGLLMMGFKGYTQFLLATDSKEVVAMLKEDLEWRSNLGNVVEDIRQLMADRGVVDVVFQPRDGNGAAHALAQFGLKKGLRFFLGRYCS
ncbi:uncharacterized protein LOC110760337 [Prunus avium]|uniref:Uncharacterized protein LOC110760337 n=1 Tax=Prunus avium TaxID=42229 RepID=A0A6P5SVX5_PRUAV|nr:uncharacterized protein LOC110760337 [Prunus avium]